MDDRMSQLSSTRRAFQITTATWIASAASGCGTLFYPERRGQPRTGRLDWGVVGMDAIGLVLFFVPGVIAFAVDYYNGTLFYPEGTTTSGNPRTLKSVSLTGPRPSAEEITAVLQKTTGKTVILHATHCQQRELDSIDEFWKVE
ncbi:MAG: hypothetical protein DWH91_10565, partial [Planctomycetota bacterium]